MTTRFQIPGDDVAYFCVVGQPVAHSLSPQIHAAFGKALGIELRYDKVEVAPGEFRAVLEEFVRLGGRGLNVTVPLKEEAFAAADRRKPRAERAAAANTIIVDQNRETIADNTDGVGLVTDLRDNLNCDIHGKRVLIVGAGGAVRGALPSLIDEGPRHVSIVNRTVIKAEQLIADLASAVPIDAFGFDRDGADPYDLVINATSMGLGGEPPPLAGNLVGHDSICYDMVYSRSGKTPFLDWCREHGARQTFDGLGMLVEQAAESFYLWHGVRPETAAVLAALRNW